MEKQKAYTSSEDSNNRQKPEPTSNQLQRKEPNIQLQKTKKLNVASSNNTHNKLAITATTQQQTKYNHRKITTANKESNMHSIYPEHTTKQRGQHLPQAKVN